MSLTRRDFLQTLAWAGTSAGLRAAEPARAAAAPTASAAAGAAPGDSLLHRAEAWARLRRDLAGTAASLRALADETAPWRSGPLPSVVQKPHPAPSGDPHDYHSIAPYSWPNPSKPDGLPWITRDGETNPEFYAYDNQRLETLCTAVQRLSVHANVTAAPADARRAGLFLRTWFVDAATRMNPHLTYAQAVPGVRTGGAGGIIDTTSLVFLFDAVQHLPLNPDWTADHLAAVRTWAGSYVEWLLQSAPGRQEEAAQNNHGTWFDAQVACFALFAGQPEIARRQIERHARRRIAAQIEPDGRQPHELRRTLALTYSTYNLLAFACLARAAQKVGIELWNWRSADGRGLRGAMNWLLPYYRGERAWEHPQIRAFVPTSAAPLLHLAWQGTGDDALFEACGRIEQHPWHRVIFSKASIAVRKAPGG